MRGGTTWGGCCSSPTSSSRGAGAAASSAPSSPNACPRTATTSCRRWWRSRCGPSCAPVGRSTCARWNSGTRSSRAEPTSLDRAEEEVMARTHDSLREGARLGVIVAATIWVWLAVVDAVAGQPFRTFLVLGGIPLFTVLHFVLNVAYGVVVVWAIHGAAREPRLLLAVAFGFLIVEFAFAMLTVGLSQIGLGQLAWVRIVGGNLVGSVVAFTILSRTHSLAKELRKAQSEEDE